MFETIKKAFSMKDIRKKLIFTFLFMLLYRLGCYIPVPGIGERLLTDESLKSVSYLGIMSMMTGGALMNGTWFAMGIGPYINSSIIIQLLTVAIPYLERLSKEGESGRRKINNYTRIVAVLLAIIQSIGIIIQFGDVAIKAEVLNGLSIIDIFFGQEWLVYIILVLFYTSGALVTVWIGERITDYGVSNGVSMLIFAGILATAGQQFIKMVQALFAGGELVLDALWPLIGYILFIVVVFGLIVWVDGAERKIKVEYAKQVKGRKMMGGQSTEIPMKVNANGVMPLIFAFSIISFPELIATMFWADSKFVAWWQKWMGTDSWVYMVVLCVLIFFFAFFYAQMQFNPEDVSKSIQQNGGFIKGIRPGKATCEYLKKINQRITLFGAIFLAFLALVPSIVLKAIDPTSYSIFTATGLLISVSCALEFNTALESQIMMKTYKGFLK